METIQKMLQWLLLGLVYVSSPLFAFDLVVTQTGDRFAVTPNMVLQIRWTSEPEFVVRQSNRDHTYQRLLIVILYLYKPRKLMNNYLHLICDYAPGDMAWAEVFSAMCAGLPPTVRIHMSSVASFDTIATGFLVGQLGNADENLRPKDLLIFANCAPRKDIKQARENNEGEGFLFCKLKNGVQILAVNSGFSLSFIKQDISELWSTVMEDHGSQFRSRDYFPQKVWAAVKEDYSFLLHKLEPATAIPEPPKEAIGYIDSFGNLKTTIRSGSEMTEKLEPGNRLKIRIGGSIRTATVATGSFNVREGDLAFAPGSSGQDRKYWELFKRGGSAWHEFGNPPTGSTLHIEETTAE